jgi:hypothetical protein
MQLRVDEMVADPPTIKMVTEQTGRDRLGN